MNISLPHWRTPFHPAWLLLLVPAVAALFAELAFDSVVLNLLWYARLAVVGVILLPLILTRNAGIGGAPYRMLKELRMHLPGCLVAFLGPGLFGLMSFDTQSAPDMASVATMLFLFGSVLMLSSAFGREFEQGTFSGLLAQPVGRGEFFIEKLLVPSGLTLLAGLNLVLMLWEHSESSRLLAMVLSGAPLVIMILVSGPYFSLVSRGTLPAVVFSLVVPHVLGLLHMNLLELSQRFWGESWYPGWFGPGMAVLSVVLYMLVMVSLAWRRLEHLELEMEGARGRSVSGVNQLVAPLDRALARLIPSGSGLGQLVRKEFRLHVIPWLTVALQFLLATLVAVMRWLSMGGTDLQMMTGGSGLIGLIALLAIIGLIGAGAAVVAEERELGTLDWQLTQPVRLRTQWWVKLGVAAVTALIAGVVLPYLSLLLGLGWNRFEQVLMDVRPEEWLIHAAVGCCLFAASVYASSGSRSTVGAMLSTLAVGLCLAFGFWVSLILPSIFLIVVTGWESALREYHFLIQALEQNNSWLAIAALLYSGAAIATLLLVSYRNFRRASMALSTAVRQGALVLVLFHVGFWIFRDVVVMPMCTTYLKWSDAKMVQVQRAEAVRLGLIVAERHAVNGTIPLGITSKLGFATPLTPEELVQSLEAQEGWVGLQTLETRLLQSTADPNSAPSVGSSVAPAQHRMDPVLLRRYGLLQARKASGTGSVSRSQSAEATNAVPVMDPVLMKRYGLQVAPPK